ncbi:hypothetical protein [Komagataeibacter rhaeticus]|uniref:hypothetical protein n=1 Tax=Komagataeibacter rhaeticus TaxID=215221 RepID=UPI0011B5D333|nr:hypothetical protein [Komagataeibacter rhaeticus]MBL7240302.1 hypothetical protein [Komagataeibacter rhaeticus]
MTRPQPSQPGPAFRHGGRACPRAPAAYRIFTCPAPDAGGMLCSVKKNNKNELHDAKNEKEYAMNRKYIIQPAGFPFLFVPGADRARKCVETA